MTEQTSTDEVDVPEREAVCRVCGEIAEEPGELCEVCADVFRARVDSVER